jgi:hypothetical protein
MQKSDLTITHVYDRIFRNPHLVLDHFISCNMIQKGFIN